MKRTRPPFRADMVGSLLRSARLANARTQHEKGEIDAVALRQIEDEEIATLVKKQEAIGLQAVTDGEFVWARACPQVHQLGVALATAGRQRDHRRNRDDRPAFHCLHNCLRTVFCPS